MATERTERELNQDINAAIAGTEDEIFQDALDGNLDDNDGDTSLEDMGEGLEGDHIDEEVDAEDDVGPEKAEEVEEEEDEEESEDETEEEDEPEEQPRDQRGRFEDKAAIPPARLRAEAQQRRQAEQREQELQRRYEVLEARFNDMQTRLNAPQPPKKDEQPAPKPDMFADPEKYEQWVLDQAEQRAAKRLETQLAERDRQQQEINNRRVDESLSSAARGERGFEFQAAYNRLTALDPRNPQARSTVQSIYNSPDPARALFDWWEENGGPEYREQILAQLAPRQQRSDRRPVQQQPRHEIRGPKPLRSLNSAHGSNSQRVSDPDMLDGSDSSVFDYATRR